MPLVWTGDVRVVYPMAVQTIARGTQSLSNVSRRHALSSQPQKTYTAIRMLQVEQRLVSKGDIMSFLYVLLSFGTPETPFPSIMHCKGKPKSSSWQAKLLQISTHITSGNCKNYKYTHFLPHGPWWDYTVLQGWPHNASALSVEHLVMGGH